MLYIIEIAIVLILCTVVFLIFKKLNKKQIEKANELEAQIVLKRQEFRK